VGKNYDQHISRFLFKLALSTLNDLPCPLKGVNDSPGAVVVHQRREHSEYVLIYKQLENIHSL
jgi:hypothetical protein